MISLLPPTSECETCEIIYDVNWAALTRPKLLIGRFGIVRVSFWLVNTSVLVQKKYPHPFGFTLVSVQDPT